MQRRQWFALGLVLALGASAVAWVRPGQDSMEVAWGAYMTPGEQHKVLDYKVGRWNMKVKMYMAPDAPPAESEGTSEMQWIFDGRYLKDDTQGSFGGQAFVGQGLVAYDNIKQKYISTWIDNMGTGILYSEGSYDASSKTFTFTGEAPDVMSGKYIKSRAVEKFIDRDHFLMQSYNVGADGKENLSMEIEYTRAKE